VLLLQSTQLRIEDLGGESTCARQKSAMTKNSRAATIAQFLA